jgi:outer membrane protein OmpA-like peptidoglycan-associated protein
MATAYQRHRRRVLGWGIGLFAVLAVVGVWTTNARIENDLTSSSTDALEQAGIATTGVQIQFSGQDGTICGFPSEAVAAQAEEVVAGVDGVRDDGLDVSATCSSGSGEGTSTTDGNGSSTTAAGSATTAAGGSATTVAGGSTTTVAGGATSTTAALSADELQLQQQLNDITDATPIPFAPNSATLDPAATPILQQIATVIGQHPGPHIEVQGYTDSDGSEQSNLQVSQRRADAVRLQLVSMGVPAAQLSAKGYGEANPIAPNDTPENKAKNRRVVFVVGK